jgi:hypothetical protein
MKTLVLAAAAALTLAAPSTAHAAGSGCPPMMCNGPQLIGIALPTVETKRPVVNAVTLPSGEAIDLR